MSFESILPIFSRQHLNAIDGSTLAYLIMAFGLGALIATLSIAGIRSDLMKGRIFMLMGLFIEIAEPTPLCSLSGATIVSSPKGLSAFAAANNPEE